MSDIVLSPQQATAVKEIKAWHKTAKGAKIHRCFGYAGTGKTTIAIKIAEEIGVGDVLFGAFTGKAASVMRSKGCTDASTIHSMIYDVEEGVNGEPRFELKPRHKCEVADAKLIILDEVSMVNEDLAQDLMSFGTPILALGDPAQLPPVSGAGYFTEVTPDVMLTEVHRQARENPIIRMSMDIREGRGLDYGAYGESSVVGKDDIDHVAVVEADQVIVGLNRTRQLYNRRMREILEHPPGVPTTGDKIICLRNNREKQIYNGSMWKIDRWKPDKKGKPIYHMLINDLDDPENKRGVQVRQEFFTGGEDELQWQDKVGTQEFTYGYAITCHKSQGSQWDNVMVFDESKAFRDNMQRWLYTAITRAAQKVTVVR